MKPKNNKHVKIRNTGILFELLVQQITADTLGGKKKSPALEIMQNFFKSNTELGRELQLYRAFFDVNKLTEVKAVQFVDLISTQKKKLNEKLLNKEKYELIKEIKNSYDLEAFLKTKVPAYKIYASIYKTFMAESQDSNSISFLNIQDIVTSRFSLIEHLIKDKKPVKKTSDSSLLESQETEIEKALTFKFLIERFNDKYNNLGGRQKQFLKKYISSSPTSPEFVSYVKDEIKHIGLQLESYCSKESNKILRIKLQEIHNQLTAISQKEKFNSNELTAVIIGHQILQELIT